MIDAIHEDAEVRMKKSLRALENELSRMRSGRASTALLDHVEVQYYGSMVPLSQAANVSISDHHTLNIQIWEKDMVAEIEKAIINSDLGLTPNTAGQNIHINLPPLTEERRKELVKVARNEGEQTKIAIRNIRRDANQSLARLFADKEISADEQRRGEAGIQKLTDRAVADADAVLASKEKELLVI